MRPGADRRAGAWKFHKLLALAEIAVIVGFVIWSTQTRDERELEDIRAEIAVLRADIDDLRAAVVDRARVNETFGANVIRNQQIRFDELCCTDDRANLNGALFTIAFAAAYWNEPATSPAFTRWARASVARLVDRADVVAIVHACSEDDG